MDPISISVAFGAIKSGISAGKQLHSMTKDISAFFDASERANVDHEKKKGSIFYNSANEEALTTFFDRQSARDFELQLRELIVNTRGLSAFNELQAIRKEIRLERKEAERQRRLKIEELQSKAITWASVSILLLLILGSGGAYLWHLGLIEL